MVYYYKVRQLSKTVGSLANLENRPSMWPYKDDQQLDNFSGSSGTVVINDPKRD